MKAGLVSSCRSFVQSRPAAGEAAYPRSVCDLVSCGLLTVDRIDLRRRLGVVRFNVARPHDTAHRQHVQYRLQLSASCPLFLHIVDGGRKELHRQLLLIRIDLHPEDSPEILINLSGAMALGATSEELSHMGLLYTSKDELIASATTAGASFPVHVSTNGSDFSLLLEHGLPLQETGHARGTPSCESTGRLKIPKR